ncbi:MAG: AAA family ATPase [Clostridiaceae bacterium]|nr:AAA family ATPase [Clostridiaceae bacterium]
MEEVVLELSEQYPAILITGPRQIGKTTMLQRLMKGTNPNMDDLIMRSGIQYIC